MNIITGTTNATHVLSADDGMLNTSIFGSGEYVLDTNEKLAYEVVNSNTVKIKSGDLMMQGRHARIRYGAYDTLAITNGTAGYLRNDVIVAEYKNTGTEESISLRVIAGTPVISNPADAALTKGNLLQGDVLNQMPLYRIRLNGVFIDGIDAMFTVGSEKGDMHKAVYDADGDGIVDKAFGLSLAELKAQVLLLAHPVGSLYWSENATSPTELFGGAWVQIKDRFILAAGDTYKTGNTGGNANATLVAHTHSLTTGSASNGGGHSHSVSGSIYGGSHNHNMDGNIWSDSVGTQAAYVMSSNRIATNRYTYYDGGHTHSFSLMANADGTHSHSLQGNTSTVGDSAVGANMPPYAVMYCWKRTA